MMHKCRRLKKILSMVLSMILIVGLAGVMPIRAIAEEDIHINVEEVKTSENNGISSGGDEMLPDSSDTQTGTGGVSGNELISNEYKDNEENGDEIIFQDADEEYFQINFYSDGILQETCEVKAGEKLSQFPELVKEGYAFIGWTIAEENGEDFDLDAAITQTMDLYAKWEPATEEAVLFLADAAPAAAQEASYSTDGGSTWSEGTFAEAVDACRSAGQSSEIRLQQDIILTGTNWDGNHYLAGDHDITVDGQGYKIIRGSADAGGSTHVMLRINRPCTVTLKNIIIDGGAAWSSSDPTTRTNLGITITSGGSLVYVSNGGKLVLEAGAVLENNHLDRSGGAGVRLEGNSSFIMKSGAEIRNNAAFKNAAVVLDNASFQMEGGSIHGNYAKDVYAVYVGEGNFIMEGGSITGNGTDGGAAIMIGSGAGDSSTAGNVQIKGGSISNNIMTNADGHGNPIINAQKGSLHMSGGEISGGKYGGVCIFSDSTMEMSGGKIINNDGAGVDVVGEFKVSGNPVITGNVARNGIAENVNLFDEVKIILSGPLTQGASIGVVKGVFDKDGVFTSGWLDKMGEMANPADYFSSDTGKYIVVKDETTGEAKFVDHVHSYGTDWKWDDTDHWHECDCGAKADQAPHTEDVGTIRKQPTETEAGEKVYKCTTCGHERIEILPAAGGGSGDDKDDSGGDKGDSGDNQDGNGGNQDSSEGGPSNGAENQGGSDSEAGGGNTNVQMNENTQAGDAVVEVKAVNESAPASLQTSEENTDQKETSGTEPKTGENMAVEVYATVAMIAGLMYLLSYFDSEKCGMTEAEKRELLTRIIKWSRKGGWFRIGLALAAIFLLLVYYHSIGKKTAGWKEVYGE